MFKALELDSFSSVYCSVFYVQMVQLNLNVTKIIDNAYHILIWFLIIICIYIIKGYPRYSLYRPSIEMQGGV